MVNSFQVQNSILCPKLLYKVAQTQSDWMDGIREQQCSSLAGDLSIRWRSRLWRNHSYLWKSFDFHHSVVALAGCLESKFQDCPVFGSIHLPINPDQGPCCCRRKANSQHDAATSILHSVDGVFQLICSVSSKLEFFSFFLCNLTPLSTSPQLHPWPVWRVPGSSCHLFTNFLWWTFETFRNSCVYPELGWHTGEL